MNTLLLQAAKQHASRIAIVEGSKSTTYRDLFRKSSLVKANLKRLGLQKGDRVCLFGEKTADYAAIQWGIWRLGGIAVTLLPAYPAKELEYYVTDSGSKFLIATDLKKAEAVVKLADQSQENNNVRIVVETPAKLLLEYTATTMMPKLVTEDDQEDEQVSQEDVASLIYTSGSTSQPKGVVTTHGALEAMIKGMIMAWEWTESDHILHFLPLHHIHGGINKLLTPLCVGAKWTATFTKSCQDSIVCLWFSPLTGSSV